MTQLWFWCALFALLLAGCGSPESPPPEKGEPRDASFGSGVRGDLSQHMKTLDDYAATKGNVSASGSREDSG